jgi:HlyD family secretion protein
MKTSRRSSVVFFLSLLLSACNNSNESTLPEVRDITESVYASGVIKASGQHDVYSTTSGILRSILVKEGDSIGIGTPLFIVDNTVSAMSAANASIALQQSKLKSSEASSLLLDLEARLRLSKVKMENDSLLLERQQILWKQQVGSKLELEQRELAYKASSTEFKSLSLQLNQMKSDLSDAYHQAQNNYRISQKQQEDYTIKSTLSGKVYSLLREPGELVTPQLPLAVIGQSGAFEIELQVDEYDIVKVHQGQKVFIAMDSYKGEVFEAIVSMVEPIMNERTRTFTVYAAFTKPPQILYPNLTAEANILIRTRKDALTIPVNYLLGDNKVITGKGETTAVKIGAADLNFAEIQEGIDRNTKIYLPGQ